MVQLVQGERLALQRGLDEMLAAFQGFPWLQVIDLDAAKGVGNNDALIRRCCQAGFRVRFGGGVRSRARAGLAPAPRVRFTARARAAGPAGGRPGPATPGGRTARWPRCRGCPAGWPSGTGACSRTPRPSCPAAGRTPAPSAPPAARRPGGQRSSRRRCRYPRKKSSSGTATTTSWVSATSASAAARKRLPRLPVSRSSSSSR